MTSNEDVEPLRSPLTKRLPRNVYNAQREMADKKYSEAMQVTRRELADEMFADGQNCVARLRLAAGFSQHQLARAAGISQPHLAKIESGRLSVQLRTAVLLSNALDVSLDELRPLVKIEDSPQNTVEIKVI